jgi:hypothetical protein
MLVHSSGSTPQSPSPIIAHNETTNGEHARQVDGKTTVEPNPRGALEAAHDAINAFFLLWTLFEAEAKVWWVFNHRAFLEAMCIGNILREQAAIDAEVTSKELLYVRGRKDIGMSCSIVEVSIPFVHIIPHSLTVVSIHYPFPSIQLTRVAERMISIMQQMSEGENGSNSNVASTRVAVLSTYI